MNPPEASVRPSPQLGWGTLARLLLSPAVAGSALGLAALTMWWNLGPAWTAYFVVGIAGLSLLPVLAALLSGNIEPALFTAFVFTLQFNLSFNLIYGDHAVAGGQPGLNVSLNLLMGLAYFAFWLINRKSEAVGAWRISLPFRRACLAFLLATALSFYTTTDRMSSLFGLAANLSLVFVALLACHLTSRRDYARRTWTMMLVLLVVQCGFYSAQRLTNTTFTLDGDVLQNRGDSGRFGGTMGVAAMGLATLEMVTLFFAQGRMFSKVWRPSWQVVGIFGYGLLCLLLSLTRSCWIGFIGGSLILSVIAIRRGTMRPVMLGRMAAFGVLALIVAWGPVHDRLDANHHAAADERFLLNYINLEMIKAHPIVGIGANQCYLSRWKYIPSFYTDGDWIYMAHNQYLLVAAETGLVGLASFIWVLVVSLKAAWRAARSDDVFIRELGTVLLVALVSMVWGMNLDFYGGMQVYTLLWFVMGFAVGVGMLADQHRSETAAAVAA